MSKISAYFETNWGAMTASDWIGLTITLVVFFGMLIAFARTLRPSKRKELEQEKYKILDED
ncbi:hypothetical protein [Hydrogenovibrio kuenenii]|uniref:hypothetical protein n=1 Tax=Hydrogenovibrio kuenenii TaxID=63658 RepID=UPI000467DD66|nr:hypothetical protein [Hydrogenovibrio kuenenii]